MVENLIDEHTEDEVIEILDGIAKSAYTRGYLAGQEAVCKTYKAQSKMVPVKSPNQQRAELIQRAREFVEEQSVSKRCLSSGGRHTVFWGAEFVVNADKRTVVCLLKGKRTKHVYGKGIAKCNPSDVLNEHIGKAIALARALEIEIPQEFLQAVQPTEVVVGMDIHYKKDDRFATVVSDTHNRSTDKETYLTTAQNLMSKVEILDDSNAIYKEESH